MSKAEEIEEFKKPIFRDIRRYYCKFCGVCRSKKSLIRSHVLSHHKDKMADLEAVKVGSEQDVGKKGEYTCLECGSTFKKPAYLKQHMQGHSLEAFIDFFGLSVKHWIPLELQNAARQHFDVLLGLVSGGRPPEKLHQECLCSRHLVP